ncbi:MAG TPA: AAA family ATPase [Candidatus Binataceae bacterium]|nr:AAA family ATPase [Candidatus Binataceae bacterium]
MTNQGSRLIGRMPEMLELRAALDDAVAGRGCLLMVGGEPGIGKTALADEISTEAAARGAQVAWGRCWEDGGAPAYWPWTEILRALLRERDRQALAALLGDRAAQLSALMPEFRAAAQSPAASEPPAQATGLGSNEPADQRFRLFDSIATLIAALARDRPLLIVLDDAHAADPASLLLLRFIARGVRRLPLLIIVTYRENELRLDPKRAQLFAELRREGVAMVLCGLGAAEVAEFVRSRRTDGSDPALVEELHKVTEGNPFFLSEIVRLLAAEGSVPRKGARAIAPFRIPDGVRAAIKRRVELVSAVTRGALTVAAVAGRDFDLATIREACALPVESLLGALDEAEAAGLVTTRHDHIGGYRFSHALIPETLYSDLSKPSARGLHLQIAQTLESLHRANLEPQLAKLAHHYGAALPSGPLDKAIAYAHRGAQHAQAMLAYEDAARLYEMALAALELGHAEDGRLRCEMLLSLGEVLYGAGLFDRARAAFARASVCARQIGSAEDIARAALGFGMPPSTPERADHDLIAMLEQARDALGGADSAQLAMILARMSAEYFWAHDPRRAVLSRQAVEIARRVGDSAALLYVLYTRHTAVWEPGNLEERLEIASEIIALAGESGNRRWALRVWGLGAHYMHFADLLEVGDIPAVDREIANYSRLAGELRQDLGYEELIRATRALMDGRFAEAERLGVKTLEVAMRLERRIGPFRGAVNSQLLILRREQGRLAELEPVLRTTLARTPGSALRRCAMAFLHSQTGRRAEARARFEELAAGNFAALPRDMSWYATMVMLAEVCAFLGDAARARTLYDLLEPFAARNAVLDIHVCYGAVAHYLAMLAATTGDLDRAEAHFEAALLFNLKMGASAWVARTRYEFAAMLLGRGKPGDRERALELAESALASAEALGMIVLKENLRELTGPAPRADAGPDGTVTIMFTDIEDSTGTTERLGDVRAQVWLREHNALVRAEISAHQGFEVKSMGDGFMIAFPSARRALNCAIAIQRACAAYSAAHPDAPIRVSIGAHTGEAIKETGDFYGKTVIVASRIGARARGGEILVSATLKDLTESAGDLAFGAGRDLELKGLSGAHRVYALQWTDPAPRK